MLNIGSPPPAEGLIKETTTQAFMKDVVEELRRQPVMVDFWAPWCGPCKQLTPVLEKVVRNAKGKVKLVKMNIDEHPAIFKQIAQQMGIQSIPAVIAFADGQPIDGFLGALPENQVQGFVERLTKDRLSGEDQDLIKLADAALAAGQTAEAADLYAQVLADDPASVPALAGMARCLVAAGEVEQAAKTLALVPEAKHTDAAVAAARAALEVATQAAALGPLAELEQKVAANAADHQARYDLALALNAKGQRLDAVEHLLEIVRRDRKWNDDGARKQLVQLFEAWGGADEATVEGRRRLSSILFS